MPPHFEQHPASAGRPTSQVEAAVRRPLRFLAAVAALALILVQQTVGAGTTNLFWISLHNAMHVPMFALLTLLGWWILDRPRLWVLLALSLLLAVGTEAAQLLTARHASLQDVMLDLLGSGLAVAGLYWHLYWQRRGNTRHTRWIWLTTGTLVLLLTLAAPARILLAYQHGRAQFPVLLESADWRQQPLLDSAGHRRWVTAPAGWPDFAGARVLEIRWGEGIYPGLVFKEVVPDWRGYTELVVDTYVPDGRPMALTAAVSHLGPARGGRFLYREIAGGAGQMRYPLSVLRDRPDGAPAPIARLVLQTVEEASGRRLLIGSVRLE